MHRLADPRLARVWLAHTLELDEAALLGIAGPMLHDQERVQAGRLRRAQDRVNLLAGRMLLRSRLAAELKLRPEDIAFEADSRGKPGCAQAARRGLHFNLAHSGGLVAAAFVWGYAVGVDVETRRAPGPDADSASLWLTEDEQGDLQRLPAELRERRILDLWVLKESYAKALGLGLMLPFAGFGFEFRDGVPRLRRPCLPSERASTLWLSSEGADQPLALCILAAPGPHSVQLNRFNPLRTASRSPAPSLA